MPNKNIYDMDLSYTVMTMKLTCLLINAGRTNIRDEVSYCYFFSLSNFYFIYVQVYDEIRRNNILVVWFLESIVSNCRQFCLFIDVILLI